MLLAPYRDGNKVDICFAKYAFSEIYFYNIIARFEILIEYISTLFPLYFYSFQLIATLNLSYISCLKSQV
jgi:hypothetical protein